MRILGIETSCDETSISVINETDGNVVIEKNILSSQAEIHAQYGGVVPEVAAREHASWIFPLLKEVGVPHNGKGIDAIAVTAGPGLVAALRIGVELAKTLAWAWGKPLVAVNHLEGHVYSVWLNSEQPPQFPALNLLVSGGHTQWILMEGHGQYKLLGSTRDDAAGEAFDKVAKLLGMKYPGGPNIAKAALKGDASAIDFPRPMLHSGDLDVSFSGLKTAVRVYLETNQGKEISIPDVAASFQKAAVDTLVAKTLKAVEQHKPKSVSVSGGVSASKLLRDELQSSLGTKCPDVTFHAPDLEFTGDNAAMIALAGLMKAKRKEFVDPLTLNSDPNMHIA
jgi:N6-L-threonylcarbamoyladenine synthase